MIKLKNYKGLLFVGDPHVWSKNPGTRLDKSYLETCLDKINQAVQIAKEKELYLIILGDLFHTDYENDITLLTRLTRTLKQLKEPCATIEGNHEKSQTKLSDDVAVTLLREAEVLRTLEKNEIWAELIIDDKSYLIGSTPYGTPLPKEVKIPSKFDNMEKPFLIWMSHHDLDFGESYPGVIPLQEIKNVDILVNGHIHKTKAPKRVGNMIGFNPGNITRLSTDCHDHIPSVWEWYPDSKLELKQTPLKFQKDVFDLTGKQIEIKGVKPLVQDDLTADQTSLFVEKMHSNLLEDKAKTNDGTHIKKSITALAKAMNLNDEFINEILKLSDETEI